MAGTTADETTFVGRRSDLLGRAFRALCFGSTVFGLVAVVGLLVYVANDAFRPLTADPGWNLVFLLTFVLPSVGLMTYFYTRDSGAGSVAVSALGLPVVGLLVGGGLVVVFVELLSPEEWFLFVVSLAAAAGVVYAHRRLRPDRELEQVAVSVVAPALAVFGVPPLSVDFTLLSPVYGTEVFTLAFSTPRLLPSVGAVVDTVPFLPVGWLLLVGTFTLPAGVAAGWYVYAQRESVRAGRVAVAATTAGGVVAALAGPLAGVNSENSVVLYTTVVVPAAVYVERVRRRGEGVSGLAMPVVVVAGAIAGVALVELFGFAGPDAWINWDYLTSAHSRDPAEAGIYPALVGSVLMILVVIVASFPLGVGAAIYLEEYAPDSGQWGSLVTLIEINIGNLAGVPSVVYGLLGLALFVRGVGFESGIVVVGGLTIGLLILPIVIISAQEAIRSVPDSRRRASYGMGATKWQTIRNVVLPEAMPGILTGTILALGRAIGETAPLLMIGAAAVVRNPPDGFFAKFSAMPRQILAWSTEIDPAFRRGVLAAGVITLLLVLLLMNASAIVIRNRYQRGEQG